MLNSLWLPYGSPSDACEASAPNKSRGPPTPPLNELAQSLILQFPKKIYDLAPPEFVTLCPEKDQDTINLCLRLIALTPGSVLQKSLSDRALFIKLPKRFDIRRFGIHQWLSNLDISRSSISGITG
jgi:hypothetical protein